MQVAEAVHRYGRPLGVRVLPIYGGQPMQQQLRALKRGVDVVVATPGRALDHIRRARSRSRPCRWSCSTKRTRCSTWASPKISRRFSRRCPSERQTALFSATMASADPLDRQPPSAQAGARHHRARGRRAGEAPRVREVAYVVQRRHKVAALARVLDMEDADVGDRLLSHAHRGRRAHRDARRPRLSCRGAARRAVAGTARSRDASLSRRRVRAARRDGRRRARPRHRARLARRQLRRSASPDAYIHRIGRTGRAGREGVAITLAEAREHRLLRNIEQVDEAQDLDRVGADGARSARAPPRAHARVARGMLVAGELDTYRVVVESLAEEYDVLDVAAAAVKLADERARRTATRKKKFPTRRLRDRDDAATARAVAGRAQG